MNILFVLYGGFNTNSANPLVLYARELQKIGHNCTIAVPTGLDTVNQHDNISFRPVLFKDVLADPRSVFPDDRQADVIHACTPREVVRRFVTTYMRIYPTPLVIYLEDNERWIAVRALDMNEESLARNSAQEISDIIPGSLSHPFYYDSFIGLADAVAVIQDKLSTLVPPWVPCETVMLGVDINFFSPQPADPDLREKYGVKKNEKVLVYHGGINKFTRPAIGTLCEAVGIINQRGFPCRLLRSGPYPLDFHKELSGETKSVISDLGMLPRKDLPGLLALAEVFVQPGEIDLFEDLRLPGKVPEFLAMGRPVLMPDVNIAHLFEDGKDAIILDTGTADEIAEKCIDLFLNPEKSEKIGNAGRLFAEKYFDVRNQARLLEMIYKTANERFNPEIAAGVWQGNDENSAVTSLLVNKLKLMAKAPDNKIFVEARQMLGEHASNIELTQHRIGGLEGRLVEINNYNRLLNQTVFERDNKIAKLIQAVTERDNTVNQIFASTSWRVTRPLRAIKNFQESLLKRINTVRGLNRTTEKSAVNDRHDSRNDYIEWVRRYDTITEEMRDTMHTCIDGFIHTPLISVLMPVYNPVAEWLIDAIESVRQQIYPNWELCIADDASTDKAIRPVLERYAEKDSRIKVVFREKNGHISAASNSALELATGEWVTLLDHDDLLREHALFWVADAVATHANAGLIYSDEDKIDPSGRRYDPHFKPDWNPDLFLSYNMICHLGAYRADLVRKLGGFREGYEGAQDYDLALRCTEQLVPKQIVHIPRVLYHWRSHPGSTAQARTEKDYALLAGERVLNDHFARLNVSAHAELLYFGMYRVRYTIPVPTPLVSLIIPTRNGLHLIKQCIDSISIKTTYKNYEIIVVDNNSDDPETLEYFASLARMNRIRILRDERPFNYSALNNAAVLHAHGEYVGLINNDIEVISPDWLDEMMGLAIQPGVGAVGARLWYPNDTLQHGGCITGIGGVAGHSHKHLPRGQYGYFSRAHLIQTLSAVTAACLVIKKSIFQEMGGLEETNLKVAFNDVDFCLRVREAGYRNVWTPYAELYHYESATRGREVTTENQLRFRNEVLYMQKHWGNVLTNDPAYNPNLTLDGEDFSYAWPPRVKPVGNLPSECEHDEKREGSEERILKRWVENMSREEKVFYLLKKEGRGLEIGPSHNPIAPRKNGYNVHILDHASAEELRKKYQGHDVNLDNIEEVDFIWHGEPLHDLVGSEQCYDWIIASNIIEHIPDVITFLMECERLLKPDGILSLIIPDKRYCFDYFNATTSTGELLDAFEQKRRRPSPGKVFDHFAGAAKRNGQIAWAKGVEGTIELAHTFSEAHEHWEMASTSSEYIDVHNWRFTPGSFRLILTDLQTLGLTGLGLVKEFDTVGCDFFVSLCRTTVTVTDRLKLLNRIRVDE